MLASLGVQQSPSKRSFSATNAVTGRKVEIRASGETAYSIYEDGRPVSLNVPAQFVNYLASKFDVRAILASDAILGDVYSGLRAVYFESLSRDSIFLARGDWEPYLVSQQQRAVLDFALEAGKVTAAEAAQVSGASPRNARAIVADLVGRRLLVQVGSTRGSYYVLRGFEIFDRSDFEKVLPSAQAAAMFATRRSSDVTFDSIHRRILASKCAYPAALSPRFDRIAQVSAARSEKLDAEGRRRKYEKLVIDLSYNSSKYEGNTYDILDTERLIQFNQTAAGKPKAEADMIIGHKNAIDYVHDNAKAFRKVTPKLVEKLHSIVSYGLGIPTGIRKSGVFRINGTRYVPTNDRDKLEKFLAATCDKINAASDPVEKAVIANTHIAFGQAFADCNKRTARMVGNAVLMAAQFPPISFKVVDKAHYHGSILTFYETADPRFFMLNFLKELQNSVNSYLGMA